MWELLNMKQLDAQYKQITYTRKTLQIATKQGIYSFGITYNKLNYTFYHPPPTVFHICITKW